MFTADALADALAQRPPGEIPALPGRTNHLRAGVMVPLRWRDGDVEALTTLRPRTLRRHGGEVSFPGGGVEPDDRDLEHTARRELHEELGLDVERVLGRLTSMPVYTSDFRLEPFVARVAADAPIVPDPIEVADVLPLSVSAIFDAPSIEGMRATHGTQTYVMPIFRPGGHVLFGATAMSLLELLGIVGEVIGRPLPPVVEGSLSWADLKRHAAAAGRQRDR